MCYLFPREYFVHILIILSNVHDILGEFCAYAIDLLIEWLVAFMSFAQGKGEIFFSFRREIKKDKDSFFYGTICFIIISQLHPAHTPLIFRLSGCGLVGFYEFCRGGEREMYFCFLLRVIQIDRIHSFMALNVAVLDVS